jgi:serine protease inhibitor
MKTRIISAASPLNYLCAALLCCLSFQTQAAPLPDRGELASANSGFAFDLLKTLVTEQRGSNIFISPYSASTALQMVGSGAEGITSKEIQQTLGTIQMPPRALYEANKEISEIINAKNTNFSLTTANAIWYLSGFHIDPAFLRGNEDYFGAKVEGLDFSLPSAADTINAWASEETQGKIDQIVTSPLDPALRVLLANAVYFHGAWEYQFDTNYTTNREFYLAGGGQELAPMMQQATNFYYCATNGYQAVQLPYQGSNLAMYVFLPDSGSSLVDLLGATSGDWWQKEVKEEFSEQSGTVILPKFNLNYAVDLNDPLQTLGIVTAFTDEADFSKISNVPLHISDVKQKAIVEVDEQGTVAAAVTTISVIATAIPVGYVPPFQMIVNRPFLFVIEDQTAATIMFMGVVYNP